MEGQNTLLYVKSLRCEHMVDPLGIDVPTPRLTWTLDGDRRGDRQVAYRVVVASSARQLDVDEGDVWDSGRVESSRTALVDYGGRSLTSRQRCLWKVKVWDPAGVASAWSAPAVWEMGLLDPSEWVGGWVTKIRPLAGEAHHTAAVHFRHPFVVPDAVVTRARVYVTALGIYELYCNGAKVTDDVFRPGWTDYHKRLQYQVYDLTELVRPGPNVLAALVGDGWYAGDIGMGKRQVYGVWPELLAQVEVELADGSRVLAGTSQSATRVAFGPIQANDLQQGETFDARQSRPGWTSPSYDDSSWVEPFVPFPGGGPGGHLTASRSQPVRALHERTPSSVTSPSPDTWIFDLGQNIVGWCRLRVSGEAGATVTIRHAEMLQPDGTLYTENLRGAANIDRYTLAGEGVEVWEPRFTFHGFRYVELTGYPGEPALDAVTGIVAYSAAPSVGEFECSDALVNQLHSNIVWGQRGNFLEVPTDCPQRDERLGWMGDAQVFAATATFNMDVAAFFTKWLRDVRDAQLDIGAYPDICPRFGSGNSTAAPGWGDAGVIVPWTMYRRYGDLRLLGEQYESMRSWIDYLHRRNPDKRWIEARGTDWGDWLSIGADSPKNVVATAFLAHSTRLLSRAATVLGRTADADRYETLADGVRSAFRNAYLHPDGSIEGDTQTVYALAIRFGLLDSDEREQAAARLVADIDARDGHLSTGFLGIAHLLPALTEAGALGVAYQLLLNDTFPSWGYSIRHGATTIWERWDGWTEHDGFQNPGMNSFNHYAFGAVGEWLYEVVGGITVDHAASATVCIRPRPGGGLTWAKASHDSIYGTIGCRWSVESGRLAVEVDIPVNVTAEVWLPAAPEATITEGGREVDGSGPLALIERGAAEAGYTIEGGTYRFAVTR